MNSRLIQLFFSLKILATNSCLSNMVRTFDYFASTLCELYLVRDYYLSRLPTVAMLG